MIERRAAHPGKVLLQTASTSPQSWFVMQKEPKDIVRFKGPRPGVFKRRFIKTLLSRARAF